MEYLIFKQQFTKFLKFNTLIKINIKVNIFLNNKYNI